jgi:competence protein ComEA
MDTPSLPTGPPAATSPEAASASPARGGQTQHSAQVALGVFLAITLGLLALRGYGSGLAARPTGAPPPSALLDLNKADRAELEQIPGLGTTLAREIADDRQRRGAFRSVEELRRVKGVGPATFEKVRGFLRVDATAAFPPQPENMEPLVLERKPPTRGQPLTPAPYPRAGGAGRKLQPGDAPINVNTATVEQLQQLPGIGPVTAQSIAAARSVKAFKSVVDLDRVKGIGPKTLEKLRPFVVFE